MKNRAGLARISWATCHRVKRKTKCPYLVPMLKDHPIQESKEGEEEEDRRGRQKQKKIKEDLEVNV